MSSNVALQPTDVYLTGGQRQHITYDGLGGKLSVEYSQVPEAMLTSPETVYADSEYKLQSRRSYVGPHVFRDGKLEYSAFAGGYFDPQGGTMYYLTDWQGNNAVVADNKGNVVQETTYYPYGEPTVEPTGQRYLFGGKEREHAGGRNAYDFGARILTPCGSWSTPDPLAEKFYPLSQYSYCGGDPINRVDRNGKWSVKVSASKNRAKYPYAIYSVYDKHGNTIFKTVVKVKGKYRDRTIQYGDTPQGRYKLLEWRDTGNKRYPEVSFGPDYLLATHYESGEGEGRDGMHTHGGRQQEPELTSTWGCIRMSNDDIVELRKTTDRLEEYDPEEKMEYMEVIDDLENPVNYRDRNKIKNDWIRYGGILPELIVTPNNKDNNEK